MLKYIAFGHEAKFNPDFYDLENKSTIDPSLSNMTVVGRSYGHNAMKLQLDSDEELVVIYWLIDDLDLYRVAILQRRHDGKTFQSKSSFYAIVEKCKSEVEYWPTPAECTDRLPEWVDAMWNAMIEAMPDCDAATTTDYAWHWTGAKRRYGIKHNPFIRFLYVCKIDPEGRTRNYNIYPPDHIIEVMREVDRMVARRAGIPDVKIKDENITRWP